MGKNRGNFAPTVLPAKCDSDVMFCLQIYQGLIIDRSLTAGLNYYTSDIWIHVSSSGVNCKKNITSLSLLVGMTVVRLYCTLETCLCWETR